MFRQAKLLIFGVLALVVQSAASATSAVDVEGLWRSGRFKEAYELVSAHARAGDASPEYLAAAARCAMEIRRWDLAADLYARYAAAVTADFESYRDARFAEWQARWSASGGGSQGKWVATAQEELAQRKQNTEGTQGSKRQLALELEELLKYVIGTSGRPGEELRIDYPASVVVMRAAKQEVDAIGIEPSPGERQQKIKDFLGAYPGNYFRHVAYRYWLYSAWRTGQTADLAVAAQEYLAEYPNHAESHGAVSRYYFEADVFPDKGVESARRSVELFETLLGIDGSLASLARMQEATKNAAPLPDYMPPGERTQFLDYLGSRYNLARYLVREEEFDEALDLLEPAIQLAPFTAEEEQTSAPFQLVAGIAYEQLGEYAKAFELYLAAAVNGDPRNRYALQATQRLADIDERLDPKEQNAIAAKQIPAALSGSTIPRFSDVTAAAGLEGYEAYRVAWGDIDRDGDDDLLLDGSVLFLNEGQQGFRDVTSSWKLKSGAAGGLFADYDNDGDLDLFSTGQGSRTERLYRNEGGHFADITPLAGDISDSYVSQAACWLDFDNDGLIDLYVANSSAGDGTQVAAANGAPDRLCRNLGNRFEAIALDTAGLNPYFDEHLAGRSACAADFDNDGDQDIYVSNYFLKENFLWENDGSAAFSNAARRLGVAGYNVDGSYGHSLGAAWGDLDNDMSLDLCCANLAHQRYAYFSDKTQLLMSRGLQSSRFVDQRAQRGISYAEAHSNPVLFDCNNDGFLDIYLTSNQPYQRSYLYLNDGRAGFHDVTYLAGTRVMNAWGSAWSDYDLDGDLDLMISSPSGCRLLRNDSAPQNWLQVECYGAMGDQNSMEQLYAARGQQDGRVPALSNTAAIGARVMLEIEGLHLVREIQAGEGLMSQNSLVAHFGLGSRTGRITVSVRFPSGRVVTRALMENRQRIVVNEYEVPVLQPQQQLEQELQRAAETRSDDVEGN